MMTNVNVNRKILKISLYLVTSTSYFIINIFVRFILVKKKDKLLQTSFSSLIFYHFPENKAGLAASICFILRILLPFRI